MARRIPAAVFAVLYGASACAAEDGTEPASPRQIIERAIAAQGGEAQVAKLVDGSWRAKVKGRRAKMEIAGEIVHQGLNKGRISTSSSWYGLTLKVVVVTNGDQAWRTINGVTREVSGRDLDEMRDGGYRSRRVRFLLPLLREPGFTLTSLPETMVATAPATGVRVNREGHRDVDIYFDTATGLLVKIESRLVMPGKPPVVLEQVCSGYREFDGVKLATKFTKYENGKVHSIEEITDLLFVDHIDDEEFTISESTFDVSAN